MASPLGDDSADVGCWNFCAMLLTEGRLNWNGGVERDVEVVEVAGPETERIDGLGFERVAPVGVCWRVRVVVMSFGCCGTSCAWATAAL